MHFSVSMVLRGVQVKAEIRQRQLQALIPTPACFAITTTAATERRSEMMSF